MVLLHGWPYDIHSYVEVSADPGIGGLPGRSSRICADTAPRASCQRDDPERRAGGARQSMSSRLMDALEIERGDRRRLRLGSADGQCRGGALARTLQGAVSVSGYLIGSQEAGKLPLPPEAELQWWYQYYFATDRGRAGYDRYRRDFAKLIWRIASPKWRLTTRPSIAARRRSITRITSTSSSTTTAGGWGWPKAKPSTTSSRSGSPKPRSSGCPPSPWRGTPTGRPSRSQLPTPTNSPASTRTGRSRGHRPQPSPGGAQGLARAVIEVDPHVM